MKTQISPDMNAWGWTEVTEADLVVLEEQLGRRPRAVVAVAARCRCGRPAVIVNRPLSVDERGKLSVFPTLFWLTSPYLVREVSVLEAEGWIGMLRERFADPEWARAMHASHAATAALRLKLCPEDELEALRMTSPRQYQVLAQSGVAGMRGERSEIGVKCLHAHLADYLARRAGPPEATNPVGREVAKLLLLRGVDLLGDCLPASGRVGALDVGSNSVRLFVGEWRRENGRRLRLEPVCRELVTTRLGAGVGAGEPMKEAAMDATVEAIRSFARKAAELGAASLVGAATSAVRDAANGGSLLLRIWEETGQSVPAISGDREAELGYFGVLGDLDEPARALWVVDVGGRSTEVVAGDGTGRILWRHSFPLGAVRLTEAYITANPISSEELAALRSAARQGLAEGGIEAAKRFMNEAAELISPGSPFLPSSRAEGRVEGEALSVAEQKPIRHGDRSVHVVAIGGTATTAAAIGLRLARYDPDAVHRSRWPKEHVTALIQRLAALSVEERRRVAGLMPNRADIIVAGLVILEQCLEALGATAFAVSEADLLQGLLMSLLDESDALAAPEP